MTNPRVLVVEDEMALRMGLVDGLGADGFDVVEAADGESALAELAERPFDAVVLDLMLPGIDGYEVLRRTRSGRNDVPILVLSALGAESNRILGLEYGADDYVVKPAPLREISLRLKAILRRGVPAEPERLRFSGVEVDFRAYSLVRDGIRLALNRKECDLLRYLLAHAGTDLSREQLLRDVWGQRGGTTSRTVDTHVFRLRQKLEPESEHPRLLLTVRNVGYRFEPGDVTEV